MFNIIFPIVVFVSLAVIVFVLGKHLPEFIDIKKSASQNAISEKKNVFKKLFFEFLFYFKKITMWLIEKIIQKIKNFLTLIQSWVVDNKEEKSRSFLENSNNKREESFIDKIKTNKNENDELEVATLEKPEESKVKKPVKSFFGKFKNALKDRILEKKRKKIDKVFQEFEEEDNFSDGIVSVREKNNDSKNIEKSLINEVVEVKKVVDKMSLDEEIGVDRKILEKKLIGKIAKNPKNKEVYRQLGELYLKMRNFKDAENCYKQVLKIAVRDIDAIRKIERIKLLKRSRK